MQKICARLRYYSSLKINKEGVMTQEDISETSEISKSDIVMDPKRHTVTIAVCERGGLFYALYFLHPRGKLIDTGVPKGLVFTVTQELDYAYELCFMRQAVQELALSRGIKHVRNLGF